MFCVYIIANRKQGAIYTGHCDDLVKRIYEHKTGRYGGHSSKYNINRLVWFEIHETRDSAFQRERQIKKWNRAWRLNLFVKDNPAWDDLFHELNEEALCNPNRMYPHDFSQSDYQIELARYL
jgi:predicted GIY-YIG superfamily endonuclease